SHLGGVSQTQVVRQSAPTTQTATAQATSDQDGATNLGRGGSAIQTNLSSAIAAVDNSNQTTQLAQQVQDGGRATGGSQVQVIDQSAPTTQTGTAQATSDQGGATNLGNDGWAVQTNSSSSAAVAGKTRQITQSAQETQIGIGGRGTQVQVVEQSAPRAERAIVRVTCKHQCATNRSDGGPLG